MLCFDCRPTQNPVQREYRSDIFISKREPESDSWPSKYKPALRAWVTLMEEAGSAVPQQPLHALAAIVHPASMPEVDQEGWAGEYIRLVLGWAP